ncbi:MAG: hypothetical protein J6V40_05175 [Clostridia bacterium]|nr:hypothetical protein [Clostridia bacterium]
MDREQSKILFTITIISMVVAMVVLSVFFMVNLAMQDVVLWQKITYFIVVGVMVVVTLFNIYALLSDSMMFQVGIGLYVVTVANIVINAIVYLINASIGIVPIEVLNDIMYLMFFSIAINVCAIIIYKISHIMLEDR